MWNNLAMPMPQSNLFEVNDLQYYECRSALQQIVLSLGAQYTYLYIG